jgi:hypothetical protein
LSFYEGVGVLKIEESELLCTESTTLPSHVIFIIQKLCAVPQGNETMEMWWFFSGEGRRSRCYGRTAALRLIVQPCDEEKDDQFFSFIQIMEHRWNEIERRKPKYLGKNLSKCHFVLHKSHMD